MKIAQFAAIAVAASLGVSQSVTARQSAHARPVASVRVIGPAGLGDLRIGRSVPRGTLWRARAAQEGGGCSTVSSPNYPGIYAMVVDGVVKRITVGKRSNVKLASGVGVGATERLVRGRFDGLRAEPHKYDPAPAKYLTGLKSASGQSSVRFEIGTDRRVSMLHVGTMPELGYVEGCA
jgi:hypothetical protein